MRPVNAVVGLALILAGCGHSAPPAAPESGSSQPFAGGSPRRLTFNLGDDRAPVWLPDGSGLLYSFQRLDRPDRDRCLGLLPPDGGRLERTLCDETPAAADSTNVLTEPAPSVDGRLAYLLVGSETIDIAPGYTAVVLGTLGGTAGARVLRTFPYVAPDTVRHDAASQLRWLDATTIVYLAERVGYERPCRGCPIDTLRTGVDVVRLDLSSDATSLAVVPGTRFASAVARGESADVIYYTLGGDSRVYRRVLSTGTVSVAHDFGSGIARDVQVVGARLIALVGGDVSFAFDSVLGYPIQRDRGGPLVLVDLASGAETVLLGNALAFRHPALAPSATRLVAEAVANVADLWMFDLP